MGVGDVILCQHFVIYRSIEGGNQPVTPSRNDSVLCSGGVRFKISALAQIILIGILFFWLHTD
jgi:hypothetical protein